jgi:energy-coupling factor transport system ATP-binding protein
VQRALVEARGLGFEYMAGTPLSRRVLVEVGLDIGRGERVAIVGRNGCGKSTLLQLLAGLLVPSRGTVLVDGSAAHLRFKLAGGCTVGVLFQFAEHQLFAATVEEDVSFGPRNQGCPPAVVRARVHDALGAVGLDAELCSGRHPLSLSGGERRRVALAGVLALAPDLLLLDEPTVGLDAAAVRTVEESLERWAGSQDHSLVFVSHDMDWVARFATRVVVVDEGRVAAMGVPTALMQGETWRALELDMPSGVTLSAKLAAAGLLLEAAPVSVEALAQELLAGRFDFTGSAGSLDAGGVAS